MFQKTDSQNECNSVSSFGINYDIFHFQSPNFSLSDLYENNSIFDDWKKDNQIQTPNSPNYSNNNEFENTRNKGVIQDPKKNGEDNDEDKVGDNKQIENDKISDIKSEKIAISNKKKSSKNDLEKNNKADENDSTSRSSKFIGKKKKKEKLNKKNLKKKVKKIQINTMNPYINGIIMKVYGGKIGQGINQKKIRKIESSERENINIAHNRILLKKSLKEILSRDISKKYTSVPPDINKKIINDLLNEENEDKRKIFNDLFNKTFQDWIVMLSDPKGELKDLYEEELHKNKKRDENEINNINQMIKNFEVEFLNKKKRNIGE